MPVQFGTITANLVALIGDILGTTGGDVLFTPGFPDAFIVVDGDYQSMRPISAHFDPVTHELVNAVGDPVRLVATDQSMHVGWSWHVDFRVTVDGQFIGIESFDFAVPSNSTQNLATITPVPGGDGQYYIIPEFDVASTTTLPPGSAATVELTQEGPLYSFAFGIPRGANGGGEGGAVATVNDVAPDVDGNVQLAPADIGAQPAGDYVSDAELANAIAGITAASLGAYVKPGGGIPKTDLAASVQTTLGKADSALQSVPAGYVTDAELADAISTATAGLVTSSALTAALLGYAPLTSGRIAASLMPLDPNTYGAAKSSDLDNVFAIATDASTTADAAIPSSSRGVANGVATLGADGKVPAGQLPPTTNAVTSVNTKTGAVVLIASDVGASPTGAYVKPGTGIPGTDLTTAAQGSLAKAETAVQPAAISGFYTKPGTGIPSTDLATAVQTSLGKADSATQGGYVKPGGGIPSTDMTAAVQASLTKADASATAASVTTLGGRVTTLEARPYAVAIGTSDPVPAGLPAGSIIVRS